MMNIYKVMMSANNDDDMTVKRQMQRTKVNDGSH